MVTYEIEKGNVYKDQSEATTRQSYWHEAYDKVSSIDTARSAGAVLSTWRSNEETERKTEISVATTQEVTSRFFLIWEIPNLGKLRIPLKVRVEVEGGWVVLLNDELGIVEGGNSLDEATDEFCTFFAADYRNMVEGDVTEFAADARRVRKLYRAYF